MANAKRTSKKKPTRKTRGRYTLLQEWVDAALKILLLDNTYTVIVVDREAGDGNHAEIHMAECGEAELYVSSRFFFESPDRQLRIVAHELCHLIPNEIDKFHDSIDLSDEQKKFYEKAVNEPFVERLSRVLWKTLPPMPKLC